jgi:hypothetical protein
MGIPKHKSWNVVMYSQGWWAMSKKSSCSTSNEQPLVRKTRFIISKRTYVGLKD